MRNVRLLLISLALISSLGIILGGESFATMEMLNVTQAEPTSSTAPIQNPSSQGTARPVEKVAMSAQFTLDEDERLAALPNYQMSAFGLNVSPNSQLCPQNNCKYSVEDGILRTSSGGYTLSGILKTSTQVAGGLSSKVYEVFGLLNQLETLEEPGKTTNLLTGILAIGTGTNSSLDYILQNSSLTLGSGGAALILQGERPSNTARLEQQPANITIPQQLQPTNGGRVSQQPSNMTALPSQQPSNMTILQQPMIEQTPSSPLPQLQQLATTSPMTSQVNPQQQQFFPSSPLTSTTGTVQPQASYYPPSSTAYPSTIYPPSGTTYPSTVYPPTGTFPSTGFPMAAAGGIGGVSTPSQIIAPWFPSLPATNCGGTFVMTVEGVPERNNDDSDNKVTPSGGGDNSDNSDNNDDNKQSSGKSNRRLAVQINSDNGQIITGQQQDAIFGQIFQGQKNIDQNKANDFDIGSIFNDCQVSTYSKLS